MIDTSKPDGEQPQFVDTTPAQETPAAPVADKPAEGEQPTQAPTQDDIRNAIGDLSSLTDAQIADLESGDPARIAAVLKLPEPVKPAPDETPPAAQEEEKQEGKQGDDQTHRRMSLTALQDRTQRAKLVEAMALVRDGTPLEDALLAVLPGLKSKAAPAPTEQEPATETPPTKDSTPEVDPEVASIQAKIALLETQRNEHKASYEYDKADEALLEITDLKVELALARRDAVTRKASTDTFANQESESREKAIEQFGELISDAESGFSDYIEVEILLAERRGDPILDSPDWPEKIASRVHSKYFAKGSGAQPAQNEPPATQIPPAPAKSGVRFPGSPVGAASSPGALTHEEILNQWNAMTPEQRDETLALVDKKMRRD